MMARDSLQDIRKAFEFITKTLEGGRGSNANEVEVHPVEK